MVLIKYERCDFFCEKLSKFTAFSPALSPVITVLAVFERAKFYQGCRGHVFQIPKTVNIEKLINEELFD
jgi:hypothetical protein